MDFRESDVVTEGDRGRPADRLAELWERMLARSFDPVEWFDEDDPPAKD